MHHLDVVLHMNICLCNSFGAYKPNQVLRPLCSMICLLFCYWIWCEILVSIMLLCKLFLYVFDVSYSKKKKKFEFEFEKKWRMAVIRPKLWKAFFVRWTHWGWAKNGYHFPDDTFKSIFPNENIWILIEISLKFDPKHVINNIPALV